MDWFFFIVDIIKHGYSQWSMTSDLIKELS